MKKVSNAVWDQVVVGEDVYEICKDERGMIVIPHWSGYLFCLTTPKKTLWDLIMDRREERLMTKTWTFLKRMNAVRHFQHFQSCRVHRNFVFRFESESVMDRKFTNPIPCVVIKASLFDGDVHLDTQTYPITGISEGELKEEADLAMNKLMGRLAEKSRYLLSSETVFSS